MEPQKRARAQGMLATLELLPMWSGVDPDVELFASGDVAEEDDEWKGGHSLDGSAAPAPEAGMNLRARFPSHLWRLWPQAACALWKMSATMMRCTHCCHKASLCHGCRQHICAFAILCYAVMP